MLDEELLLTELSFKAIKSSGAGGQHVNKTASKVELTFNVEASTVLNEEQKELLLKNLQTRLSNQNVLILQCGESRSQHKNKALVIERFLEIIKQGLIVPKKRKKTAVPKAVKQKRLQNKRQLSEKKANRKPPEI
ncbi:MULTISPECIES: alternative ribosome rescue aminoacyl-tRNA hydrolase ArfB [Flavobacteriaceae]|uniref:alternative ribosome rescue aminoacyl-tRNA hydrolase ArfB n=1 Tax=Flavobacteriaceae TaxID=49546 RepID=UPI00103AC3FD|nr:MULTISPECIES: alternative ribosome rescue aminoacyl-tRNA hydrolase ArfB [Flavobacteriaceae]TBV28076.1 aminoacyl-tRNA hydrolase [Meridianimaribacter sp. CL38]